MPTPRGFSREAALGKAVSLLICKDQDAATADVLRIPEEVPGDYVKELESSGALRLSVNLSGERVGTIWLTFADDVAHVAAAVCNEPEAAAIETFLPVVESLALKLGKKRLSLVTARPGLIRKLSTAGFGLLEARLIKNL
jgi:hypothetical protein